jgi:hypothetical protein
MPEDVIHGRWVLAYPLCKSTSRLVFQYQFPRQIRLLPSSSSDSIPGLIIYYKFLQVVLDHISINERPCWLSRSSPSSSSPASIQSESTADPWRTGTTARADDRSIAEQEPGQRPLIITTGTNQKTPAVPLCITCIAVLLAKPGHLLRPAGATRPNLVGRTRLLWTRDLSAYRERTADHFSRSPSTIRFLSRPANMTRSYRVPDQLQTRTSSSTERIRPPHATKTTREQKYMMDKHSP